MAMSRQQRSAENELMNALSSVILTDPLPQRIGDCPSIDELRSFVRGKARAERRETLVAHLSSCNHCIGLLRKRRERRTFIKEVSLALAATAVLIIAIWLGFQKPAQIKVETATIDLRPFALTRGGATAAAAGDVPAINAKAKQLRLLLPAGSEGQYECEILGDRKDPALTHLSGETTLQNHDVVLELPIRSSFRAGQYTLALRRKGSEWLYYPIVFK
jgi:hypothetical protein